MSLFKKAMQKLYKKHFTVTSSQDKYLSGYDNPQAKGIAKEIHRTGGRLPGDNPDGPMMPQYSEWRALNVYHKEHEKWHHSYQEKQDMIKDIARGISDRLEQG